METVALKLMIRRGLTLLRGGNALVVEPVSTDVQRLWFNAETVKKC